MYIQRLEIMCCVVIGGFMGLVLARILHGFWLWEGGG